MESPEVRLEIAILAADEAASVSQHGADAEKVRTILVIGAEAKDHETIRSRFRDRDDVRIVVAPTVAMLLALAKVDEEIAKLLG